MRFYWLLPAILGVFWFTSPARADRLESWRFDANRNQLFFTTDIGVQPRAQLVPDPTRLVIDLPGIKLDRPKVNQVLGRTVRSIRIAQFDPNTTRIVVELAPGYTMDPTQVRVRGTTPNQWSVQMPAPQPLADSSTFDPNAGSGTPISAPPNLSQTLPNTGSTQVQSFQVTPDGFFIRVSGSDPEIETQRTNNREQIQFLLKDTTLSANFRQRDVLVNRYGVRRVQFSQIQNSPSAVRVTLNVSRDAPDWYAAASGNLGGIALVPSGGVRAATDSTTSSGSNPVSSNRMATIESVSLEGNGTQLVIRANQALSYRGGWDRSSASYRITVNSARLAENVQGPQLSASSPLLRLRLLQEDPQTVAILLQPASGVQVGALSQISNQMLALQLQPKGVRLLPPGNISVPPPVTNNPPITSIPRVPNGRIVVVIDPGHGGPDPGAIGIGGLRETNIVLPIGQQVAAILEQNGVQAVLTRQSEIDLDLEPRVQIAERVNASLFVSIHANSISLSRPDVNGIETYYYGSGSERLARVMHSNLLRGTGGRDRGVRTARFYVLRRTSMPAVLLELGFVTGREDAARLADPAHRSQIAAAIARGILQYISQEMRR